MFQGIFRSAINDANKNYIFGTGSIPIQIKSAQLVTFADGTTKQQGYQVAEVNKLISTMLTGWNKDGNKPKSMSNNYLELILSCDNGFVVKKRLQFPHIIAWKDDSTPYNIADIYKQFSIDNWLKADDFENPDITLVVEPTDEILTTSTATPPEATTTNSGRFYLYYRNLPIGVNRIHIDFHIKTKTEPIDFDLEIADGMSWKDAQIILASDEQAKINVLLGSVKDVYKYTGAEGNFEEITMHEWSELYQQIISLKPSNKFTHDLYFYIYDESELNTKITELEDTLGVDKTYSYSANDFFGLALNDRDKTFKNFVELGYNGILIPIKKGASYSVESSQAGVTSIILLNEVPYAGLTLQNDKLKFPFVNTDNYKYLYITVKTTSFQGLSLREKLDGIKKNVENLLTLPIRVDSLEDKIGYDKSAIYTSENFYGFYWNGTKFLGASSSYNGILVPLKSGVDYTLVGNSTSKIILNALPIGDSGDMLVRTIGGTTFRAEEGELYLFVTISVSSFSSFVVNSKLGGLIEKTKRIDILDEEIGYAKNTTIKKEDCYGFYWNGTKFIASGSSDYDGVFVPLVEGSECSFGANANGVISRIIITELPPTGTLARESPESFVAGENEKYLYVTIKKNSYNDDLTFLSTKQGIARNTMFLEKRFGQSLVKGKKALFFGDSITCVNTINEDGTLTLRKYNWSKLTAIDLELEDYIYAQDGARWTDDSELTQYQKASEQITLAMSKHDTADIVILSLGTNNWGTNNDTFEDAMSKTSLASLDRTKINQAIRWCLWTLRDKYKTARFFVFLPLQRAGYTQKSEIFTSISKMAEVYGCYVFDQFSEVGICHVNEVANANGVYLSDGLHPNIAGKMLQSRYCSKKIIESYIEP